MGEPDGLAAAVAAADQQLTRCNAAFDGLVREAQGLLPIHDATSAWALLGVKVAQQLDCTSKRQQFAAEMVAAAAIRAAQLGPTP